MNAQKVYLMSEINAKSPMPNNIGTGLLTIKNMGLFTSIEIVDVINSSIFGEVGTLNHRFIRTGNNYLYNCIHFQVPKSVPHDTTHMCAFQ